MDPSDYVFPPENNVGPAVLIELYILLFITIALIVTRAYVSFRITHIYDWSDYTIWMATSFLIAGAGVCTYNVHLGLGQHLVYLPDPVQTFYHILWWNSLFSLLNNGAVLFTKYSISLYILRIRTGRGMKIAMGGMMVVATLLAVAACILWFVSCIPTKKQWQPDVAGNCLSDDAIKSLIYMQSGITIVVDLGLTITPLIILWDVQIARSRKAFIVSLMSLGLVSTLSNALRNGWVWVHFSPDYTYDFYPIAILSILELTSAIIAACIPTCVPIITQYKRKRKEVKSIELQQRAWPGARSQEVPADIVNLHPYTKIGWV